MTGVAIPQDSDELEELLHDNDRLTAILAAGEFGNFTQAYMRAALGNSKAELGAQMREQVQLGTQQLMQGWEAQGMRPTGSWRPSFGGGQGLTGLDGRRLRAIEESDLANAQRMVRKQGLFSATAAGAAVDGEDYASSFGAFFKAVFLAEKQAKDAGNTAEVTRIQDYKGRLHNALAERIPSEGGFLVPETLRSEMLMVALEEAVVRPLARVIPMDSLRLPLPAIDDTSHASSVYGGVVGYWTEEAAALIASAPSFQRFTLEARKLTAYTTIPNELLADSIVSLDAWFSMFFPKAIAYFEDYAFINGSGTGEPQGFLNSPGAITVTRGTQYHILFNDIAKAYSRMWPASLRSAVWTCSPDVLVELLQLAMSGDGSGTTVAPPLWLQSYQATGAAGGGNLDGRSYMLMGRPLVVSEKLPSNTSSNTTTAGALNFTDFSYYLIGDRQSMQIASSEQYLFASDLMAYRVIERVDGRFWLQSPITPAGTGGSTLSPSVIIDTH
jgi:HK97 family phage major capsid protein